MLPPVSHASATKISSTSPSDDPFRCPRATASVEPLGPSFGYETYTYWLSLKFGCTATKCNESLPCPAGVGDVHTGFGSSTPLRISRSAPFFSVTRTVFASANAMPHGWKSPLDGDDANLSALDVEYLRTRVARRRGLLRADGEGEQDDGHGLPHAS